MKDPTTKITTPPRPPAGGHKACAYEIIADPLKTDAYHKSLAKRYSPYRRALEELASAKRGSVARFASLKAYQQIRTQAKRLGYTCHYAVAEGQLYVTIADTGDDK